MLVALQMRLESHDGCEENVQVIVAEDPVVDCQTLPLVQRTRSRSSRPSPKAKKPLLRPPLSQLVLHRLAVILERGAELCFAVLSVEPPQP